MGILKRMNGVALYAHWQQSACMILGAAGHARFFVRLPEEANGMASCALRGD
jgi:hypothetical protein